MTTIVVLGSNSFSGATFCAHALENGTDVIGVSRSPEPHKAFLPYRWGDKLQHFRFLQSDLNHDLDAVMNVIEAEKPAYVVNFAAQSMVAQSWDHPEHWFQTNAVGATMLFDRLRRCEFLERYVHITTPEVYGSTQGFIREDAPFKPSTPYAVSRAAGDMSLRTFVESYGFPAVSTRAANVYGPGQRLYRIIPRTILFIRLGRRLQLHGGGQSERSFVHIGDVSNATWRVMLDGNPGETYHISTDEIVSVRRLVERICQHMDVMSGDVVEEVGERLGKDAAYMLDSSKIRETLGWHDGISLDAGIDECIDWVDRNLNELKDQPLDYVHQP